MSTLTAEQTHQLTVLRDTVRRERPAGSLAAQPTGTRLLQLVNSMGWSPKRQLSVWEIIQLSAVLICLDVLSQDIGKTTFRMYEKLPNGGKRELAAEEHPIAMLLQTYPNRFHTWSQLVEQMMLHLGVSQNAFLVKRLGANDYAEELIPAMPGRTTILAVVPDDDPLGRGFYAYDVQRLTPHEQIQFSGFPSTIFLEGEMIHLRGRSFDGLAGYSNLEAGAKTFGLSSELVDYQTRLFANDGTMRGVFQHPGEIGEAVGDKAFDNLRMQIAEQMTDLTRKNRPIILEEGMTFEAVSMNSEQAEIAKARDMAVVDVARTFRIPPHKIFHLINVKYENMETLERSYVQDTLIPYCRRIEQTMERSLFTRKDHAKYFLQFDRVEMLLNDIEKIAEVLKDATGLGAIELDEYRTRLGWNPLANDAGKVRLIPSTYNLVDQNNKVVIAAGAKPAEGAGDKKPAKPKKEADDAPAVTVN